MPTTSSKVKISAVKGFGAGWSLSIPHFNQEHLCFRGASAISEAHMASAYDCQWVVNGNGLEETLSLD